MLEAKSHILTQKTRRQANEMAPVKGRSIAKGKARTIEASNSNGATPRNTSCNIKVVVRVRPSNEKESSDNLSTIVKVLSPKLLIFDPKEEDSGFFFHGVQQKTRDLSKKVKKDATFTYDHIFDDQSTNHEIFLSTTKDLIDTLMDGYNCSVFAYGATGAGKTHTMIGNKDSPGIMYLTISELFEKKQELAGDRDFDLMVTYIEIYNELVKDLLNPGPALNLLEDAKYGVRIPGLKGHKISCPAELFSLLEQGNKRRTQHPTDSNAESSRSHAVFQVYAQMTIKSSREMRCAKLSMIDLAGSERGSATGYVGARFKEGSNINKSLLALGNCINSLADGNRHVPYRDSKLTRLLKDSLGGNCHTIMIANVSPSSLSFDDTYNTLKYALRAKSIKSSLKLNIINTNLDLQQCFKLNEDLKRENADLKKQLQDRASEITLVTPEKLPILKKLVDEKKELMERQFKIQLSEQGMSLRRELKEDIKKRLSAFYVDSPDKAQLKKKISEQVERFHRKEFCTNEGGEECKRKLSVIEEQLDSLVKESPDLEREMQMVRLELTALSCKYREELLQKKEEILKDALQDSNSLLERMATLINPLYMAAGGSADAPAHVRSAFEQLKGDFGGRKNVKFGRADSVVVNGVSPIKRKLPNDEILDNTYVKPATPSRTEIVAKGKRRLACAVSPRRMSPRNALKVKKPWPNKKTDTKTIGIKVDKPRFRM